MNNVIDLQRRRLLLFVSVARETLIETLLKVGRRWSIHGRFKFGTSLEVSWWLRKAKHEAVFIADDMVLWNVKRRGLIRAGETVESHWWVEKGLVHGWYRGLWKILVFVIKC